MRQAACVNAAGVWDCVALLLDTLTAVGLLKVYWDCWKHAESIKNLCVSAGSLLPPSAPSDSRVQAATWRYQLLSVLELHTLEINLSVCKSGYPICQIWRLLICSNLRVLGVGAASLMAVHLKYP